MGKSKVNNLTSFVTDKFKHWRYLSVGVTLSAGVGLSILAATTAWKWEEAKTQSEFER